jgi:hypothetical protein
MSFYSISIHSKNRQTFTPIDFEPFHILLRATFPHFRVTMPKTLNRATKLQFALLKKPCVTIITIRVTINYIIYVTINCILSTVCNSRG